MKFIKTKASEEVFLHRKSISPCTWKTHDYIFRDNEVFNLLTLADVGMSIECEYYSEFCIVEFLDDRCLNRGNNYFKLIQENIIELANKLNKQ